MEPSLIGAALQGGSFLGNLLSGFSKQRELRRQREQTERELGKTTEVYERRARAAKSAAQRERFAKEPTAARDAALDRAKTAEATGRLQALSNRGLSTASRIGLANRASMASARAAGDADAAFFERRQSQRRLADQGDDRAFSLEERAPNLRFQYSSARENQLAGESNQRMGAATDTLNSLGQNLMTGAAYDSVYGDPDTDFLGFPRRKPKPTAEGGVAKGEPAILEPGEVVISREDIERLLSGDDIAEIGQMIADLLGDQASTVPGEGMGDKVPATLGEGDVVVSNDDVEYIMSADSDEERGERLVEVLRNYERKFAAEQARDESTGGQADLVQEIISTLMQMGIEPSPDEVARIEALSEQDKQAMLDELRGGASQEPGLSEDDIEDYAEDEMSPSAAFGIPDDDMDALEVGASSAVSRPRGFGMRIKPRR